MAAASAVRISRIMFAESILTIRIAYRTVTFTMAAGRSCFPIRIAAVGISAFLVRKVTFRTGTSGFI